MEIWIDDRWCATVFVQDGFSRDLDTMGDTTSGFYGERKTGTTGEYCIVRLFEIRFDDGSKFGLNRFGRGTRQCTVRQSGKQREPDRNERKRSSCHAPKHVRALSPRVVVLERHRCTRAHCSGIDGLRQTNKTENNHDRTT